MTRRPYTRTRRDTRPAPPPLSEMPDPLTPTEVALLLRISAAHVYRLIQSDGLKCVRLGNSRRAPMLIYHEDLEEYISKKRGRLPEGVISRSVK